MAGDDRHSDLGFGAARTASDGTQCIEFLPTMRVLLGCVPNGSMMEMEFPLWMRRERSSTAPVVRTTASMMLFLVPWTIRSPSGRVSTPWSLRLHHFRDCPLALESVYGALRTEAAPKYTPVTVADPGGDGLGETKVAGGGTAP